MDAMNLAALAVDRNVVLPVVAAVIAVLSFIFGGGTAWKLVARIRKNLAVEELRPAWMQDIGTLRSEMVDRETDLRGEIEGRERLWDERFQFLERRVLPSLDDNSKACRSLAEAVARMGAEVGFMAKSLDEVRADIRESRRPRADT